MKTAQERLTLMHQRAAALLRKKDKVRLSIWGGVSALLLLCLISQTAVLGTAGSVIAQGTSAASSLLAEETGGYVLAAVAAFMAGVILTVLLTRRRRQKKRNENGGQ